MKQIVQRLSWVVFCFLLLPPVEAAQIKQVCFQKNCFEVELAQTFSEQLKGLMFRESLPRDRGMLFIYPEEILPVMYMKNTLIPLDLIWIDKDERVIHLNKNTPVCKTEPCPRYASEEKALFVLEINAGLSDALGIREGDHAVMRGEGGVRLENRSAEDDNPSDTLGAKLEDVYDQIYEGKEKK